MDASAFASLTECIAEASFEKCEQVPAGDSNGYLIQPLGGIAVGMAGPARYGYLVETLFAAVQSVPYAHR